jgi:hypothetical protein
MDTPPVKLFDVILHPHLKKSWIHFEIEAKDETGRKYFDNSSSYGVYAPPYPAFPCYAVENHFTKKYPHGYTLEPFDVNQIMRRLDSYQWLAGVRSIKFSNQVYVCPITYVAWTFAKKKIEGTSHFEVKELPKNNKNIWVCDEQALIARGLK